MLDDYLKASLGEIRQALSKFELGAVQCEFRKNQKQADNVCTHPDFHMVEAEATFGITACLWAFCPRAHKI
jgi:hypothetical protein